MKVLMINTVPMQKNGITNVICNLVSNTEDVVIDCVTINTPEMYYYKIFEKCNGNIYVLKNREANCIKYMCQLVGLIRRNHYDCVHVHGNSHILVIELFAAWIAGCKVRIAHSHNSTCVYKKLNRCLTIPFNIFCTNRLACGMEAGQWLFGKKSFDIINNGIDLERFRFNRQNRIGLRKELDISDNDLLIGHIGEFNNLKNQVFLLELLGMCQRDNIKILFVGEGNNLKSIKEKAHNMHLENRTIFLGAIHNVSEYMSAIDIIVMPSLFEGFPLTLIEEQANGLSCIVSDNITKDVDLTGNVSFCSLDSDLKKWVSMIQLHKPVADRTMQSEKAIADISKKGFDIRKEAVKLEQYYETLV